MGLAGCSSALASVDGCVNMFSNNELVTDVLAATSRARRRGAAGNVAAVAKRTKKPVRKKQPARRPFRPVRTALRYGLIAVSGAFVLLVALIVNVLLYLKIAGEVPFRWFND